MKKLLCAMLSLVMLLTGLAAVLAEPAPVPEDQAGTLPEVGEVIHGFEVKEERDYPLIDARILRFEHMQTGAELFYVANDDTNRAFDLTFFTEAIDNTGLPHVFEHATLSGSKKYPSAALFFNLIYQSYNTYLNASTSSRYTTYPCASLSEAQLLKLADLYTDSCFNPMILEDESIYRTEAWRYRLADAQAPLTIEGTVYSEMLGAITLDSAASVNALRAMYPGSTIGNIAGGDPDFIPDMTWEMLKDYHDRYYHPSNCVAYLYGSFEDYAAFLQLLDGYFSVYERREFTREDEGYTPITQPVVQSLPFPVEQGSDTRNASTVYYMLMCPGLNKDTREELVLNTLTDLLIDGASDFQQSLQAAIPYGTFQAFIEEDAPEDAIVFTAENVNPEDAELFKTTVDAALQKVAEEGFPQDQVDGVMASLAISALLTRENSSPVNNILHPLMGAYAATGDPWNELDYTDALYSMDDWNRLGLYAKAVSTWLVGNETIALVTTYPDPGAKEAKDAALAERLARVKAEMSQAEIDGIVAASNAPTEDEDASEYVAKLQAVTVASLPEELKSWPVSDETDENGVRHIDARASLEGIGSVTVLLDTAGFPQEDLHWLELYSDLLGELDTEAHTKAEIARLFSRYLYNGSVSTSLPVVTGEASYHPYLNMSWIALDEDLEAGYDLMRELVFDTRVDDPAKLAEQVASLQASLKSSITANPASTLLRRALATTAVRYRHSTYVKDIEYYQFLTEVEKQLQDDPESAVARLEAVKERLNNRENAVAIYAGSEAGIAANRKLSDAFLAGLDRKAIEPAVYDFPVPAQSEALVIDSGVQYNLILADYPALDREGFTADLDAVTSLVSDVFLIPMLRDQYGVYSPMHTAMEENGVYIYAYRDPNITETFDLFDRMPQLVSTLDIDQDTLDGYILSAYSGYAMPQGELSGALSSAMDVLQGKDPGRTLDYMRQLKQLTPEEIGRYVDLYARLAENGVRATAGGASAINDCAGLYDAVLNPFGAVDAAQVALSDVPEGSAHFDAVRFAFEEGFMAPAGEDTFGVDDPATKGDLLAALYVLAGGTRDEAEALAAFTEYGLVTEDTDLTAPIAPEDIWGLLSALTGETVEPLTECAEHDRVTRGELAEALMAFAEEMEE
ncbi:MAG: insulinase family protein [Clostridia bacterium]|nr:insulinase family protein [Clostridia bacterium]